jgi:hypothetical protein
MIKLTKLILFILLFGIIISCEDDFDPNGQLQNKYILNCIIHGDTSYQVATISKTYFPVNGESPAVDDENAIKGAVLRIWSEDKIGIFQDSTIITSDNSKPYSIYCARNFQPDERDTVEIEAIMPNGEKLTAKSVVPEKASFTYSECTTLIFTGLDTVKSEWRTTHDGAIFSVKLKINYLHLENDAFVQKSFLVPKKYIDKNGKKYPVYPDLTSSLYYEVLMETVDEAMKEIAGDDSNKSDYYISGAVVEVLSMDDELSKYYYSTNREQDSYSINLDETDYTNINGGGGIFGITIRSNFAIKFTRNYVESFGYQPFF